MILVALEVGQELLPSNRRKVDRKKSRSSILEVTVMSWRILEASSQEDAFKIVEISRSGSQERKIL